MGIRTGKYRWRTVNQMNNIIKMANINYNKQGFNKPHYRQ